ncbi:MAG: hypothetical protein HOV94_02275, partial [Saccharothrix sp.]|nr:hypothetical protein [Saccharothrix sp.]
MAGQAELLLRRFGRRYAAVVRLATVPLIGAIALLRATPEHLVATALVVGVAVGWTCGYGWWLRRTDRALPVAVDVVVLLGVGLSVFVTDAVEHTNTGWLRLLVTFACVTYQWHTSSPVGLAAALVVDGGFLAATTVAAGGKPELVTSLLWVLVAAGLSRVTWL